MRSLSLISEYPSLPRNPFDDDGDQIPTNAAGPAPATGSVAVAPRGMGRAHASAAGGVEVENEDDDDYEDEGSEATEEEGEEDGGAASGSLTSLVGGLGRPPLAPAAPPRAALRSIPGVRVLGGIDANVIRPGEREEA
jgi:hypothetical protein